jgi:ubiquinone/menaquinone biosynthesis C-methylase UbiE
MNQVHLQLCASSEWATFVEDELLPLRRKVKHLTAVEVVQADATLLPFESDRFDAATCFTMLHHVPTTDQQDRLLAEVRRVLRSGGLLVGTDSTAFDRLAELHEGDIYVPVDPVTLPTRLAVAGFSDVEVEEADGRVRFVGRAALG